LELLLLRDIIATNPSRNRRDDHDELWGDYDEEPRRQGDRVSDRGPKERLHRDDNLPPPSRVSPSPTDIPVPGDIPPPPGPPLRDKNVKIGSSLQYPTISLSGRNPEERKPSKGERDIDLERRVRSEPPDTGSADSGGSGSSVPLDDITHSARKESRLKRDFNLKDTMDLKALKEALNLKDTTPKVAPKEPARTPRESWKRDPREVTEIRKELNERRPRDTLAPSESHQLRIVSPPREKMEEKPVKGILRAPRERFPEDPAPLREGVAPLKDAKKDGIPPDARWTKIGRNLVNPEALKAGKERFEEREDFVIVLRVLSRDEVQGYAEVTHRIRGSFLMLIYSQILTEPAARKEREELEAQHRRRVRRERHERHKRERHRHRRDRDRDQDSTSESGSADNQDYEDNGPASSRSIRCISGSSSS
jgi:hypothetical protein